MQISSALSSTSSYLNMDEMDSKLSASMVSAKDTDSSGDLSASELGVSESDVAQYDSDGDGVLSSAELAAALKSKREKMQSQMSTQMEQSSQLGMLQSSLGSSSTQGASSDGKPSVDDMIQGLFSDSGETSATASSSAGSAASNAGSSLSSFMEQMDEEMAQSIFSLKDADESGDLTAEELGVTAEQLAKLDADGDGTLNDSELAAGLKTQREAMMAENGGMMPPPPPPTESSAAGSNTSANASSGSSTGSDSLNVDNMIKNLFASSTSSDAASTGTSATDLADYLLRQRASNAYQSMDSLIAGLFAGSGSTSQSVSLSA